LSVSEKSLPGFLFEMSTGQPVNIEPFHYAIIGQTQFSGKTTLIKRLSQWAVDLGYKILIFDTKETEADYAGFGQEVPVCLRETTDAFVLIGLLESMFRRRLTPYYATLSRLTEAAKGFGDIIARARDAEEKTKNAWLRDAYRVLYDLLERLQTETAKVKTVPRLELHDGLNRMVINEFSLEAQQLVMKNSFEDLLRVYRRNAIGVIDEAFKFLPQGYSSAATRAIMNVMTQGAKTGLFGWISTQFLAVTDKDPLKACAIKFLGTQDHITEVKHTLDLIPEARGKISADDIMKLKLGHWILVRKRPMYVGAVYALPVGAPGDLGARVARGGLTPEYIRDTYLKPVSRVSEDTNLDYKEAWEKEKAAREEAEKKIELIKDDTAAAYKELGDFRERYQTDITEKNSKIARLEKELEAFQKIKEGLLELMPAQVTTSTPSAIPSMPGISVADVDERINQRLSQGPGPIPVVTVDVDQRIKELVRNEVVNRIVTKIQELPEPAKKAAWWLHERKQAPVNDLYNFVYGGQTKFTGRAVGLFQMNVIDPLVDAWLIVQENGIVRWTLKERLAAELKDVLSNDDVDKVPKYLASLLL